MSTEGITSDPVKNSDLSISILSTPIEELNLSRGAYNTLKRAGVHSIGQILDLGETGVSQIHQIGPIKLDDIFDSVAQYLGVSRESLVESGLSDESLPEESIAPKVAELPISVLELSRRAMNPLTQAGVNTIDELLKARSSGLEQIRWLGEKSIDEIENALAQILESSSSMTDEELEYLRDPRPFLITVDAHGIPNLVKLIVPFSKALLKNDRDLEILKRQYGLESSETYTLQEIGYYYDITRQRVGQIRSRAMRKIRQTLLRSAESKRWRVPENVIEEASDLSNLLRSRDQLLTEQEIIQVVEDRYHFTISAKELNALRFLLRILGFRPLPQKIAGFYGDLSPAWVMTDKLEKPILYRAIESVHRTLRASVMPLSLFDLKIGVNRRRKKKIENEYICLATKACYEIESTNQGTYQIKFEHLPSLADKAYRILHEANEIMHIRDIWRQTNHRLAKAGCPADARMRSLREQLATDPRFEPVGRSGKWSLSAWKHVRRDTILELMQEFFHLKQSSATLDEVCEHVSSRREGISRHSVYTYLSTQKSLFTRVSRNEYELSAWGGKPYKPKEKAVATTTTTRETLREAVQQEIKSYLGKQPNRSALVADVAIYVMKMTNCKRSTFYRYLSDMENVRKKYDDTKLHCYIATEETGAPLSFPQVERIEDESLKEELYRAVRNLNIDNVDLGLFQLGKIFENELKAFLLEARRKGDLTVTRKDLQRLASMIDCVARNRIVKKKHHLTLLREKRNERAHGKIPGLVERKRLMQYAPFLGDLYIDYIIFFHKKRSDL